MKDLQTIIQSQKNYLEKERKKKNQEIVKTLKSTNQQFDALLNQSLNNFKLEEKPKQTQQLLVIQPKFQLKTQSIPVQIKKQQIKIKTHVDSKSHKQVAKNASKQIYHQLLSSVKQQLQKQQQQLFGGIQLKFCPICHQDITYQTPIYQCKQICKNYYHIKCLKFWVKHQRKNLIENDRIQDSQFEHRQNIRVTCPMCRTKFPQKIDHLLIQNQKTFKKYYQSHNIQCNQCHQDIYLKLYHCLHCKDWNLCDNCYKGWKHQNHDRFIVKDNKKAQWSVPPGRSAFNMTKLEFSLEYIKKISKNSNQNKIQNDVKQLFGQNYSKFLQSNSPKPDLIEYLKQSLINIQKEILKTYKKVDYNQQTLKCLACKKHSIIGMKRIFCSQKHFIDQKCLAFFLKNNIFTCPLDKNFILEGLSSITLNLKHEKKKQTKKQKK